MGLDVRLRTSSSTSVVAAFALAARRSLRSMYDVMHDGLTCLMGDGINIKRDIHALSPSVLSIPSVLRPHIPELTMNVALELVVGCRDPLAVGGGFVTVQHLRAVLIVLSSNHQKW